MLRVTLLLFLTTTFLVCVHGGPVFSRFDSLFETSNTTTTYLSRRTNKIPTGRHIVRALHDNVNIPTLLQEKGLHFTEPVPIPLVKALVGQFDDASKAKLPDAMNTLGDKIKIYVEYEVHTMTIAQQRNAPWGISRVWSGHTPNHEPMAVKKAHKGETALRWDFQYEESAGECATIYVVDSGIYLEHSDFEGRATWSATFVKKGKPEEKKLDLFGHGTEVASIAAGKQFGIAKKARLVSVKVGNKETMRGGDVILGLNHVAEQHAKDPSRFTVVNLSVGTDEPCELTDLAAQRLIDSGIYVVAAAGNDGQPASAHSPGRVQDVITVGASTVEDKMWEKSSHGPLVDIFAPGAEIPSATIGGPKKHTALKPFSGTSLAAPHVAGLIAYLGCLKTDPVKVSPKLMGAKLRELATKAADPQVKVAPADTPQHFILHMPKPQK